VEIETEFPTEILPADLAVNPPAALKVELVVFIVPGAVIVVEPCDAVVTVRLPRFKAELTVAPSSSAAITTLPPPVASIVVFLSAKETAFRFGIAVRTPVMDIALPETFPEEIMLVEPL
jgi:hypothetical protein